MINPILAQSPVDKLTEGPFFGVASTAAASDITFWVITAISAFFLVLISGIMGWFMWKYRRTSHVADTAGPTHHTPLEVTWTIIPLILVIAIFYVGMTEYLEMRTPPANTYDVHVTAQKWSWTFAHPNGANETNILLVPANRPVKCTMESLDVLHALYIPAFRTKQDVVPGRYTMLWFEANQPGLYDLYCAEYCGLQHSQMIGRVQVLPIDEFNQEIEKRARWLDPIAMEDLWWKAGPRLYNRCASCHSVNGEDMTGPTYKGLWRKLAKGEEEFKDGSTLKQLIDNGKVVRAFLGVSLDANFGPETAARMGLPRPMGAHITALTEGAPAAKAKLLVGDVILQYNNVAVEDDGHLVTMVGLTPVGKEVPLLVFRRGKTQKVTVRVGQWTQFQQ